MEKSFLYERRIEAGLSQSDIANALGYTVQLVSMWESGKNSPSLSVLGKYASLLQIDLEGIIYSKNIKKNNLCDELSFNAAEFANNIKRLRKKKNLTQKQVADAISCNVNQLIKYEKGSSFPSIEQFILLGKLFKTRLDVLYFCLNYKPEDIQKEKKKTKTLLIVLPIITAISSASLAVGITLAIISNTKNNKIINSSEEIINNINWTVPKEITHTLGYYPQSLVSDEDLIGTLNSISARNEFGYTKYNDEYYECVKAKVSTPTDDQIANGAITSLTFNNGEIVKNDNYYWFKVEPIKWKTIGEFDNGEIILFADLTLDDGIIFDDESNDYKESYIRNWLNNDFYNKAFYDCKDKLMAADIYNMSSTDYVFIPHALYWPGVVCGSSEYARTKGALGYNNDGLFSWCIKEEIITEDPYYEPDITVTGSIGNNIIFASTPIDGISCSGIIPLIVIKNNK
jgi:transcriptional regulator with XRE-family HTH domain